MVQSVSYNYSNYPANYCNIRWQGCSQYPEIALDGSFLLSKLLIFCYFFLPISCRFTFFSENRTISKLSRKLHCMKLSKLCFHFTFINPISVSVCLHVIVSNSSCFNVEQQQHNLCQKIKKLMGKMGSSLHLCSPVCKILCKKRKNYSVNSKQLPGVSWVW